MTINDSKYILIEGNKYKVIDALNNITLADSFVKKNKIGSGHGEAKLYVGQYNDRYKEFFDNPNRRFFFLKEDFDRYMVDAKDEYYNPQQEYKSKFEMPKFYDEITKNLKSKSDGVMPFRMERVDVKPPRVYFKSNSNYFNLLRTMALPNISYLSIMKLEDSDEKTLYYCKLFLDYSSDINTYESPMELEEEKKISSSNLTKKNKENLLNARKGQGGYRNKLLDECPSCPFTSVSEERMLIASHIKPWVRSNDKEKVDPKNGFIFTPTYDRLFDQGFITFNPDKKLVVSPWISRMNQQRLNIYDDKIINKLPLDDEREKYLKYHRKNVFKS